MNGLLINDLISLLLDIPPVLAAAWAAWFVVGLTLSVWGRREKSRLVVHVAPVRQNSGVRAAAGARSARPAKPAAAAPPAGDAFGDLEAMLDAPLDGQESRHRTPGDVVPAPQSLP